MKVLRFDQRVRLTAASLPALDIPRKNRNRLNLTCTRSDDGQQKKASVFPLEHVGSLGCSDVPSLGNSHVPAPRPFTQWDLGMTRYPYERLGSVARTALHVALPFHRYGRDQLVNLPTHHNELTSWQRYRKSPSSTNGQSPFQDLVRSIVTGIACCFRLFTCSVTWEGT